ncbi:MAG: flagellar biosynthesis protein FlhA [Alphaproteobacteria bacterium]|nr:MAG: flagellar biosynthesis protein FlhA [Alphaproteobacteria bacterium]
MSSVGAGQQKSNLESWSGLGLANRDVVFAVGVVLVLGMLFIPLPPLLLDFGLAVSLSLSVLILMVSLWIRTPLEFNSFPTLLLVVTMLRLALNVSSTRLILSRGHTGPNAAGDVIEGFASFIVSGDFIIGIVIFAILVTINFVVITKGSTRIAEVAARFSLDAMPGKQMAIDADLGAGVIDDEQAHERRKLLEEESAFFGAMDGASKFVRGDAIAGLVITLINIIGGILIGVASHDLSISEAASNYTVLTIGDGLVTQIPALVVSLAAGLLVTKGSTQGAANEAVLSQLGNFPKALVMASVLSLVIGLLPGFPFLVFAALSAALAATGYAMSRRVEEMEADTKRDAAAQEKPDAAPVDPVAEMLRLDDVRLNLGMALVSLVGSADAALPGKIKSLRNLFIEEFGFVVPPVRIKDEASLPSTVYAIELQGVEVARGEVHPGLMMVILPDDDGPDLPGKRTREPTFGLPAVWVDESHAAEAERLGLTVVDAESVTTTHLTEVIKEHMPDLLTYSATQELVESLPEDYRKLVAELPTKTPSVLLQHVLQSLLAERVSIRNLPRIVEAVAEASASTQEIRAIVEHVRSKLAQQICSALSDANGFVPVITLGPQWERELNNAVSKTGEESGFIMSPARVQDFILAVRQEIQKFSAGDDWPALLVSPAIRPHVRSILERVSPSTQVLSHNEIHRKVSLRSVGTVGA